MTKKRMKFDVTFFDRGDFLYYHSIKSPINKAMPKTNLLTVRNKFIFGNPIISIIYTGISYEKHI